MEMLNSIKDSFKNVKEKMDNQRKIDLLSDKNVVMGLYCSGSEYDAIMNNSEATCNQSIFFPILSISNGDSLTVIGQTNGPCEQYKTYANGDSNDVIVSSKCIEWEATDKYTIDEYYNLLKQYEANKFNDNGYQKRR